MPDTIKTKTVLVTSATGNVGRRLPHRLLATSFLKVRLLVRNRNRVQLSIVDQVEVREGSTFDKESLAPALRGVDTAFYLIHSMGGTED